MKNLKCQTLRLITLKVFLLTFLFSTTKCDAQSRGSILALSKADHTLAIVDPVTLNIIARIPVGMIRTKWSPLQMERPRTFPFMAAAVYMN